MPRSALFPYTTLFRSTRSVIARSSQKSKPSRKDIRIAGTVWHELRLSIRSEENTPELQSLRHLACRDLHSFPTRRSSDLRDPSLHEAAKRANQAGKTSGSPERCGMNCASRSFRDAEPDGHGSPIVRGGSK